MLCIAAFIVFLLLYPILGIFSADYRYLFKKSWQCVFNRITLKPCDINLGEEIKGKLLGKIIFKYPKLAKFLDKSFDFVAFLLIVSSIWSLFYMVVAGVNLLVYDTCTPQNVEGCSLSGSSCGINQTKLTFKKALDERRLGEYAAQPFTDFGTAVSLIPDRLKTWKAEDYIGQNPSYYQFNQSNPIAVEAIDPGCISCARLFKNIKESKFYEKYNLTYLLYPIPDSTSSAGTRFYNSKFVASYVEATKKYDLYKEKPVETNSPKTPGDWLLLQKIFENAESPDSLQNQFNLRLGHEEAKQKLQQLLKEIGYSDQTVAQIAKDAESEQTKQSLAEQKKIVDEEMRTIKIPTIIFDGRRYNRVLEVEKLK
jgi:hypothetical protein